MGCPATKRRLRVFRRKRYPGQHWIKMTAHDRDLYHRDFGSMRECHERLMREHNQDRRRFERDIIRYYLVACRKDRAGKRFPKLP